MSTNYYENTCKYYWETLQDISNEKKMAIKLEIGLTIPEFFYFYGLKIGTKKIENTIPPPGKKGHYEGSFFNLVKFLFSLEADGKNKEERIDNFRRQEPSWYTQELLRIIAEQKVAIGIGKEKLKEITKAFVPLRRPAWNEEFDSDDDYTLEEPDEDSMGPLEEAELYEASVMLAKNVDMSKLKVQFPAMVQKKYDGTRRLVFHTGKNIFYKTRQGKNNIVPNRIADAMELIYDAYGKPFVLDGEFYVPGVPRAASNGIANKKDIAGQDSLVLAAWDFIPLELYTNLDRLEKVTYINRFKTLKSLLRKTGLEVAPVQDGNSGDDSGDEFSDLELEDDPSTVSQGPAIEAADTWQVDDLDEALDLVKDLIALGEEGGVLKDYRLTFKDGRSDYCVKLKAKYDCTLEVIGINPGEGKFAGMIGSFIVRSSDGKLKVSVSGMKDDVRSMYPLGREANEYWIGQLMRVTFLELNKPSASNPSYSLHSPQYDGINDDVDRADDLATIQAIAGGKKID